MEPIFIFVVVVLAVLAVSDLIVGVSNDAVNFLNSAIGSNAAPRYVIMIIASIGIVLGSMLSSGMMEVARSGVFYPAQFNYQEIMMLFLAVMLTDVILLDMFNTLGMPTSTTVSLVFELLGSAVAVAAVKIWSSSEGSLTSLGEYINASKALVIISGILISVVVSFVCGTIVMYITRLIFSFRYQKTFSYYGAIWCGIALTSISYFAIFKGLKGAPFVSKEFLTMLSSNLLVTLGVMVVFWTIIMGFLQHIFKVNILKITVLAGTLSLALAFAGNDLVNFIGVFMGGLDSFKMASASGDINMMMGDLSKPVSANIAVLMIAGVVMTVTLWFSRKARRVTDTEVNLASKNEGEERFGSTMASRALVRSAMDLNRSIKKIMPAKVINFVEARFAPAENSEEEGEAYFDLIRATVNLTVASILISSATALKLPLSTTYVTFMVAMGSSLSDRAWGRESAVYRITGVLAVISGWFLTAFIAFAIAFIIALLLMYGGTAAIIGLTILSAYLLVRSNFFKKNKKNKEVEEDVTELDIVEQCKKDVEESVERITQVYDQTLLGLFTEDRKLLKKMVKASNELFDEAHKRKHGVMAVISNMSDNEINKGHYYVQVTDYLNEMTKALIHITRPSFDHIENNHSGFSKSQVEDLKAIEVKVLEIYKSINDMLQSDDYTNIDETLTLRDDLFEDFAQVTKNQIVRLKEKGADTSTRTSMLYFNIILETKTMILQSRNLLKAQKYFVTK